MTIYSGKYPGRLTSLVVLGVMRIFSLLLFQHEFKLAIVVGGSMLPTLRTGDIVLVDRRAYVDSQPRRGDLVVARYHKIFVIKRIVSLPGEEVEVKKEAPFSSTVHWSKKTIH